jgi:hypothetical protein
MLWWGKIQEDQTIGLDWLRAAAEEDHKLAIFRLGEAYEKARGTAENIEEAAKWYSRGVELGHADCQAALGALHLSHQIAVQDPAKAHELFHDPATIRKDGNIRRMWELWDFKKRDKYGAMSGRWRTEFDCKLERYRNLGFSIHSDPMAGGTVLLTGGEDNTWMAIAPDTRGATALNIVCAK